MATWYEARTCFDNPRARSVLGARPTLATSAIGELCADTLFEYGLSAVEAVKRSEVNDALENIVEANTLLSGMGFESGGLAVAHSIGSSLNFPVKSPYGSPRSVKLLIPPTCLAGEARCEAPRLS